MRLSKSDVAVYAEGISGGVPFLPRDTNITIGRLMFGFGAALCFGLALYGMQRFFKSHK